MSLTIFIDCVGGKGVVGFVVAKLHSYFFGACMASMPSNGHTLWSLPILWFHDFASIYLRLLV